MTFDFECEESDGLVVIDTYYLNEIDEEMRYAFEILLDRYGQTELTYDFPDEKWEIVRERETAKIRAFCNTGKMIVFLADRSVPACEISFLKKIDEADKFLHVPSGKMLLVSASELIQSLAYPELEMEKILEVNVEKGMYAVSSKGMKEISCFKSTTTKALFNNVVELPM